MQQYIKSPLNYTGGKHKLLGQIIPLFPDNIRTFVDLFGGGFNVGINVQAEKIIYNDISPQVVGILNYFKHNTLEQLLDTIDNIVWEYSLSKENRSGYLDLREYYNNHLNDNDRHIYLYTLVCHAFSNQLCFNGHNEYNVPFGKRNFNVMLKSRFCDFIEALHNKNVVFANNHFSKLKIEKLNKHDIVYCDPPYLNTDTMYNRATKWGGANEQELLQFLDTLTTNNIKFALSNNITTNATLAMWADDRGYITHYINMTYNNCMYQKKDKVSKDKEVLITNY